MQILLQVWAKGDKKLRLILKLIQEIHELGVPKKMNEKKTIDTLRYRIKRYREMGNGAMCQDLLSELRQVIAASK